ncbi:MAG: hypothetical protein WB689_19110 [Xanthobacteraceae bacterium]
MEKPAIATSEATSISPIPVEKPKPATSRVRPTIPIPLEKPATVSTDAPMPVTPSTPEPPPPHIKMLRVISNGATDTLVQHNAKQQQNTPAMTAAPVPEQSPSPTSDQAHEPARAAIIWPDPSKSIVATTTEATTATSPEATTATAPEATTPDHGETPTAARTEASTESNQRPTSGAQSADAAEPTAQANASTTSPAAANVSVMSEPVEMSLVAALGLVVAGFLFRIAIKIASARRRRIIIDPPESRWLDEPNEHALRDEQPEPAHQREELIDDFIDRLDFLDWMDHRNEHKSRGGEQRSRSIDQQVNLIDDLEASVILTASDDTPSHLFRNDDELQETLQRRDREPDVADEIRKREHTLEQLKRDLDGLLRSPNVA